MRTYTASIKTPSASAAMTLIYIECATDAVVAIMSAEVVAPDDDTNEQIDCSIHKITGLGTPTVTATIVPSAHDEGDSAFSGVCKGGVTANEPTYALDNVTEYGRAGASTLGGYRWQATNIHEWIWMSPNTDYGLRRRAATTSRQYTARMTFGEVG